MHVLLLRPLLMLLQLKDEVALLKAVLRTRDAKLAAAEESSAAFKAEVQESRQQVGAFAAWQARHART